MRTSRRRMIPVLFIVLSTLGVNCAAVDPLLFPSEQIAKDEPTCAALTLSCGDCASNEKCGWCVLPNGSGGCHAIVGSPKRAAPPPSACSAKWIPMKLDCPIVGPPPPPASSILPPRDN